jgi:hypothetical protein
MINLWVLSAVVLACIVGLAVLRARRKRAAGEFGSEPLSTEWLSQARSREEHGW